VLGRGDLVMGALHRHAELLQRHDALLSHHGTLIGRVAIEVAIVIEHAGIAVVLEEEVLDLRAHVTCVAQLGSHFHMALEYVARIALVRCSVRLLDVAEHAGDTLAGDLPRKDAERLEIRPRHQVRLFDAHEALDGRAVEALTVFEHGLDLAAGDACP